MPVFSRLHPSLQETLVTGLGWDSIRPVQEQAYEAVAAGSDVLILAPTAGGKTEAAFLPVIDAILKQPTGHMSAIYLSPLKALINDQVSRVLGLIRRSGLEAAVQHGDVPASQRFDFTRGEPDVLLTTPESLEVLLSRPVTRAAFAHLRYIIVDEIHAFVETARGAQMKCLIDRVTNLSSCNPIRIGLSATVGNPQDLLDWYSDTSRTRSVIAVPSPAAQKRISFVLEPDIIRAADRIADMVRGKKSLVFVDSRSAAERLYAPLAESLTSVYLHHSAVSADGRSAAEQSFDTGGETCVICTSTMELGIDIGDLDLAVNFGPPLSVASFLQRLGRCGRRGRPAEMTFVVRDACELMMAVATVEAAAGHQSERLYPRPWSADVLVQQLLSLIRIQPRISRTVLIAALHTLTPFADIPFTVIAEIITYLLESGYLAEDGSLLLMGPRAETELGHANWRALISVLSDTGGYTAVLADGTVVGTLDSRFIAGAAGSVFTFTGKSWRLLGRDDVHRRVLIESSAPVSGSRRPFWSGSGGAAAVSPLVAASCGRLIARGKSVLPLPDDTAAALDDLLSSLPRSVVPGRLHLRLEPDPVSWSVVISTFAGDTVNRTLTLLLKSALPHTLSLRATPFAVRISGFAVKEDCSAAVVALHRLASASRETLAGILPPLPDTAWKFGALLPESVKKEMAVVQQYDLPGVMVLLAGYAAGS